MRCGRQLLMATGMFIGMAVVIGLGLFGWLGTVINI